MAYEIELKVSLEDKDFVLETLTKRGCNWEKSKKQYDKIYYKKDYTDFNSRKDIFCASGMKIIIIFLPLNKF